MRSLLTTPFTQIFEGVGIALDAIRANKVARALTIMGVARRRVRRRRACRRSCSGINESFARDVEAAGPTSFFVYRRPIGGFRACDRHRRDRARSGAIRRSRSTRRAAIERLPTIHAVTAHVGTGASVQVQGQSLERGHRGLHAELDRRRRRRHLSRAATSRTPRTATAARVRLVNDKLAADRCSAIPIRSTR